MSPTRLASLSALLTLGLVDLSVGQPSFSTPSVLSGDATIGDAAGPQNDAVIARGGDQYLVVWEDDSSLYGGEQTDVDIWATRVDLAGNPIDATPFPIANGFGYQRNPQVAWNGSSWLVTYDGQIATQTFYENGVLAVRVSLQGQILDTTPITLFTQGSSGAFKLVAMNNLWVIVSQSSTAGQGGIKARRLAADGQFLDPTPVTLVAPTFFLYTYVAYSTGNELLVGWNLSSGSTSLTGHRYDANLTPIGSPFQLPNATIASNGTSYYATWTVGSNHVGSPMSTSGVLQFPNGVVIGPSFQTFAPRVTATGTGWWASWTQINQGFKVARISQGGTVQDVGGILIPETTSATGFLSAHQSAGSAAGDLMIVYTHNSSGFTSSYDVVGIPVDSTGNVGTAQVLCQTAPHQQRPHLASGPSQFLASFVSEVSGSRRAMVQRVGTDGNAIDVEPTLVASGELLGTIRAAWNGTLYLVVWSDNGQIQGRRMLPNGAWLDPAPFHVLNGGAPDVAALGDQFLVVGQFSPMLESLLPVAQIIDGFTGAKVGATLTLGPLYAQAVRVDTIGGRWIVAWQRNYTHDNPQAQAEAAFVDVNGVATPSFLIALNGFTPAIATTDSEVMFVYRQGSLAAANNDIYARRMLADGSFPSPSFVVTGALYKQMAPTVTFDGEVFLAAWEDRRDGEAFFDLRTDIYGARISSGGLLLDPVSFPIETAPEGEANPTLANNDGTTLYASSTFHPEAGFAAWRIATRTTGDCVGANAAYGEPCPGSGGYLPSLFATGCPLSGEAVTIAIGGAIGGGNALMFIGTGNSSIPLAGCTLLVSPLLPIVPVIPLPGSFPGEGSIALVATVPLGTPVASLYLQAFIADPGVVNGVSATNGLRLDVN